ncbi:MAG TPA: ribonuclease HII [Myxococcales bacterium]|nr:ribonuclease HII [Myxococcales bacterium]HAN32650.1 ribonuclease HII [Myxococcales bacterium]
MREIVWKTSEDARAWSAGQWPVIGTDEVGRGPLAGPVVAAAVILPADDGLPGLKDSKATTSRQREALVPLIEARALAFSVVEASVAQITERNILGASLWAMGRAVSEVLATIEDRCNALILVDGNRPIPTELLSGHAPEQIPLIKGDSRSRAIAAAAILAKVHRDTYMQRLHQQFPHYGFEGHKGYPTAAHLEALRRWGPCPAHRPTFGPVARLLKHSL